MKNRNAYSVGALLYTPANRTSVVDKIRNGVWDNYKYSLAFCLEDTINPNHVEHAVRTLFETLHDLSYCDRKHVPDIYIRPRSPEQLNTLIDMLNCTDADDVVTGFIAPKFSVDNANQYLESINNAHIQHGRFYYLMPIFEISSMVIPSVRSRELESLLPILKDSEKYILNCRVGGNDLCNSLGVRRHANESIYAIKPIMNVLSDVVAVYGNDFVISGAVWEYYGGDHWMSGLIREIKQDVINGFCGKTLIHPKQIQVFNEAMKVSIEDYTDAMSILNRKEDDPYVWGTGKRMQEYNCHMKWAEKIKYLADYYGVDG